jgi:hypothetical protein
MRTRLQDDANHRKNSSAPVTLSFLQHKSGCGQNCACSACSGKVGDSTQDSPTPAATLSTIKPGFGHDFGKMQIISNGTASRAMANDQTESGGLDEEFMSGGPAATTEQAPTPDLNLGEEEVKTSTTPVIDQVDLITSSTGAVGGYPAKEDMCDASLSKPGPFNDVAFRGSVANVHQVQFHVSQGYPGDLRASRVVNRTATGRGKTFPKSGNDGPPEHEYQFTKDKMVVADAPGWCSKLVEEDFPVSYSGDFAVYAWDAPTKAILASISYHVEIKKTHFSQGDPVNTVTVTDRKIGGVVPSPVKPKK